MLAAALNFSFRRNRHSPAALQTALNGIEWARPADRQNWFNTAIRSLYEVMNGYSMWKRHIASLVFV
jgi:hypothetical protein